jgi:hypothetical protein
VTSGGLDVPDLGGPALDEETEQTVDLFTTDSHFRMLRQLTGKPAFQLLPEDL